METANPVEATAVAFLVPVAVAMVLLAHEVAMTAEVGTLETGATVFPGQFETEAGHEVTVAMTVLYTTVSMGLTVRDEETVVLLLETTAVVDEVVVGAVEDETAVVLVVAGTELEVTALGSAAIPNWVVYW